MFHIHSSRESLYFQSVLDSLQRELWYFSLPVMSYSIIRYRILLKDSKMRQVWSMVLILFLEGSEWGAGKWERGVSFLFEWCLCFFFLPRYQVPIPKLTSHAQSYKSGEGLAELTRKPYNEFTIWWVHNIKWNLQQSQILQRIPEQWKKRERKIKTPSLPKPTEPVFKAFLI